MKTGIKKTLVQQLIQPIGLTESYREVYDKFTMGIGLHAAEWLIEYCQRNW
jgi:hypothetical protein